MSVVRADLLHDNNRACADWLQRRADELRGNGSAAMHRVIRATDHEWVEIQADYLGHLLGRIELLTDEHLDYIDLVEGDL